MRLVRVLTLGMGWAVAFGLCCDVSRTEAASGDAAGTYTVTITKVEISKDSGTTYITIFEGSQAINIAAANAGAVAAGLASGVTLDTGVYDRVRVTLAATMQVKGFVNSGANTLYTDGDTEDGAGASTSSNPGANSPGANYAASTYTIPAPSRINVKTASITVEAGGKSMTFTVSSSTHLLAKGSTAKTKERKAAGAPGLVITDMVKVGNSVVVRYTGTDAVEVRVR